MGLFNRNIEIVKSNSDISTLLPIGSVVELNDGEKYIISNYAINSEPLKFDSEEIINSDVYGEKIDNNPKTFYEMDYLVTSYPMGNNQQYILHSDICGVLFQGYNDDQRYTFLNNINSIIEGGIF